MVSPNGTLPSSGKGHQRDTSSNGTAVTTPSATAIPGPASATPQRNLAGNLLPNGGGPDPDTAPQESMFLCLQDLFQRIQNHSKKNSVFTPTAFVAKVKKENELFRGSMHQDAHEFLMFIMSTITEDIEADLKRQQKEYEDSLSRPISINGGDSSSASLANGVHPSNGSIQSKGSSEEVALTAGGDEVRIRLNGTDIGTASISGRSTRCTNGSSGSNGNINGVESSIGDRSSIQSESTIPKPKEKVWIQKLFEGQLTNEIKCLTCEKTTNRAESFMDLSLDIEQNSSVTSCLRQFSASEMLCHKDKFYCDECCGLQEAEKRMKIQVLPNILCLHLKRFKYQEALQKYVKLSYRVSFPLELRLFNTVDDMEDPDRIYDLNAFVVHIGSGPHHGHYVAVVKHQDRWLLFDDDTVETIDESDIHKYFGDSAQLGSGYVLFYQARDLDMNTIAPIQWAQQQLQQQQQQLQQQQLQQAPFPLTIKTALNGHNGTSPSGLSPGDLDPNGGLKPHRQQQELINQQLANKHQQQVAGGGGFGSLFGSGVPAGSASTAVSTHPSSPRSPTAAHLPHETAAGSTNAAASMMLHGQRISSGSYVYTNGVAAGSFSGQPQFSAVNGYNTHPLSSDQPLSSQLPSKAATFSGAIPSSSALPQGQPPGTSTGVGAQVPPLPPIPGSMSASAAASVVPPPPVPHTTIDLAKLKRAQSSPRITLATAAKSFGAAGGKSFIGSLRGSSGS
ncbi:hypothetical protein BGW38_006853 [Lunasporangiospora selenospora]|uniref:ubiquitinyl hydrolase 1 n=1 Tax=Lunasporangiospora selenospora TaxID=979761 RepID=A0A9P6FYU8_9FUNG|nr:hypothetical protein BGW38_006853 [Lunasporangiospora selenospora]